MLGFQRAPRLLTIKDDDYTFGYSNSKRKRASSGLGRLLLGMAIGSVLMLVWQEAQALNSDRLDDYQQNAGQLLMQTQQGGVQQPALQLESAVHFSVSGIASHVQLKQRFRNDSNDWVEGRYVFPLPEQAAVNRLRVTIGERVIEGKVFEKQQAAKLYNQAKQQGRKAGLVSQQRPNLFTTAIANIGPGETIEVEIDYLQTLAYEQGQFSLRFPMTITPRYVPGVPLGAPYRAIDDDNKASPVTRQAANPWGWTVNTDQVDDAEAISPWMFAQPPTISEPLNPIRITADIDMGLPMATIDSAYHDIVVERDQRADGRERYQIRLTTPQVPMDRDFELHWQPVRGAAPQAAVFSEHFAGEDYALIMLVPPKASLNKASLPKEVIYLIDTSGSMAGVSMRQAKLALQMALTQLKPHDRFNVIEFNSQTRTLFAQPMPAVATAISAAQQFVDRLDASGGTEMLPALQAALATAIEEPYLRQVIFITDGAVANEAALFALIGEQLQASRLFTVAIGSAPNSYFMRKSAQLGRGTFTQIGHVNEVQQTMSALFAKLNSPVMSHLQLQWPEQAVVDAFPDPVPDLYRGEPVMIKAKLQGKGDSLVISGSFATEAGRQPWQQRIPLDQNNDHKGMSSLWARQKIEHWLDQKMAGKSEFEVRAAVLPLALKHQLLSPYSSFLAQEIQPSRPSHQTLKKQPVANLLPHGQAPQSFTFPQTATGKAESLLLAALFLTMAVIVGWRLRDEEGDDVIAA